MYQKFWKRIIDILLSAIGILVLTPVWLILAVAIKADDPGPIFFRQKRIAQDKDGQIRYFQIYKYRSMKMCTPKDTPTHLLENPEQYITKVGGFLRKTSLDELPQIFNIFLGQMSIIGPRPALWNQEDLYAERAKYGANAVKPGLTGWAQINGRDELPIDVKAKLDGEYVEKMSFLFDVKCFLGTISSVLKSDGVVEGGTGAMEKEKDEQK
ncbi:MAG: sugar transferase [Clostridia bacterium]|nr:sugar transferase [Clostridia bacterium]MBQ7095788.1 sugar transferase [Clostridia bacterium]